VIFFGWGSLAGSTGAAKVFPESAAGATVFVNLTWLLVTTRPPGVPMKKRDPALTADLVIKKRLFASANGVLHFLSKS
jgi:hypothetical protein